MEDFRPMARRLPDDALLRGFLSPSDASRPPVIAIVGAKDVPGQPVDRVGRYLLDAGYAVLPVHHVRSAVWGMRAYPDIASLPSPVTVVVLFRASQHCPAHARDVLALPSRPVCFWMQSGIASEEACAVLSGSGIVVVEDACIMVEHARLFPRSSGGSA
jgi:predicted CoA-binding protein